MRAQPRQPTGAEPWPGAVLPPEAQERRKALRIAAPFPAMVRGTQRSGDRFERETVLDNLSACGLYFSLAQPAVPGARLFIVIRLSIEQTHQLPAPCVAVRGVVLRVDRRPGGMYGLAVAFTRHRFLYMAQADR
jgi:hypothetical protein